MSNFFQVFPLSFLHEKHGRISQQSDVPQKKIAPPRSFVSTPSDGRPTNEPPAKSHPTFRWSLTGDLGSPFNVDLGQPFNFMLRNDGNSIAEKKKKKKKNIFYHLPAKSVTHN